MLELHGRSSSHFSRVARIFAHELEVPHRFVPVLDLVALDAANYGQNPALKLPVLVDEQGPLFGTENICRELTRRSGRSDIVLRGQLSSRALANAEELTLHVMSAEVALIMAKAAGPGHAAPPKVEPSLHNGLRYLDEHLPAALAALPPNRLVSFLEVSLFCVFTHLSFREIVDTSPWRRLTELCERLAQRPAAQATPYRFDQP